MLNLQDINKSFSGVQVLFNISADINANKVTAIIGENGAGKSTLMNILSGAITDHSGKIHLNNEEVNFRNTREARQKGITIIHQELNILPDLTAGENIFLGREPVKSNIINYKELYSESDNILKQFRFPFSSNVKMRQLSVGWQQIVEIARAISLNTNIIIMDEPTSALSDTETEILFEKIRYLRENGKTVLFISHRIAEVLDISDEIIIMRDGRIAGHVKTKETNREELIFLMAGNKKSSDLTAKSITNKEVVLRVNNVNVHSKTLKLNGINFTLHKGEVLGIAGLLGSGRTEVLKFLYGEYGTGYTGDIFYRNKKYHPSSSTRSINNRIIYLPENRKEEGIFPDHSLIFNAGISVLKDFKTSGLLRPEKERVSVEQKFDELNVKRKSGSQKIRTLSGGNQQKVLLSRILLTDPEIILLDDPTRGIDIASKEEIYDLIYKMALNGISVIMTSSEIPELLRICRRILVLSNGKQTALVEAAEKNTQDILNYAFHLL